MTKIELKAKARKALEKEYGFAPTYKAITLLEANESGQYILFSVNGHEYSYDSHTIERRTK